MFSVVFLSSFCLFLDGTSDYTLAVAQGITCYSLYFLILFVILFYRG